VKAPICEPNSNDNQIIENKKEKGLPIPHREPQRRKIEKIKRLTLAPAPRTDGHPHPQIVKLA
jgi:hypothetical protein